MSNSVRVPFFAHLRVVHEAEEKEPWIRGVMGKSSKQFKG